MLFALAVVVFFGHNTKSQDNEEEVLLLLLLLPLLLLSFSLRRFGAATTRAPAIMASCFKSHIFNEMLG
jgi:hypothetical protein